MDALFPLVAQDYIEYGRNQVSFMNNFRPEPESSHQLNSPSFRQPQSSAVLFVSISDTIGMKVNLSSCGHVCFCASGKLPQKVRVLPELLVSCAAAPTSGPSPLVPACLAAEGWLLDPAVDAELAGWVPPSRIFYLPFGFPCSVGQARHLRAIEEEKEKGSRAEPSAAPVLPLGLGEKEAGAQLATFAAAA